MSPERKTSLWGYLIEFETVDQLMHAAEKVRDAGFDKWDAHSPFPVHGLDKAMGVKRTILPYLVFVGGFTGLILATFMQWWMNAYDYPYVISGKPFWSIPANFPVMFEVTVLFSAFSTFFGMLGFNQLPELYHPLFSAERFRRVTSDRFFISIEAKDPKFHEDKTRSFADTLGGAAVEAVEEEGA